MAELNRPSVKIELILFTVVNKSYYLRRLPLKELQILLVKNENAWVLPLGNIEQNEDLEHAVHRNLQELTQDSKIYYEQLYTTGEVTQKKGECFFSCSYVSLMNMEQMEKAVQPHTAWFTVRRTESNRISPNVEEYELSISSSEQQLQFKYLVTQETNYENFVPKKTYTFTKVSEEGLEPSQIEMILLGLNRLKNKIEYTPIAFNLVPEFFTLSELQQVYELILNAPLLKANFRRKILPMVLETKQISSDYGHRPAKLFRFNRTYYKN